MKHIFIISLCLCIRIAQAQDTTYQCRLRLVTNLPEFPIEFGISKNITTKLLVDVGIGYCINRQIDELYGDIVSRNGSSTQQAATIYLEGSALYIRSSAMKRIRILPNAEINLGPFYSLSLSNQKILLEIVDPLFDRYYMSKSNIYVYHIIGFSIQQHISLNRAKSFCLNLGLSGFMPLNKPDIFEDQVNELGKKSSYVPGYGYNWFPFNINFGFSYLLLK